MLPGCPGQGVGEGEGNLSGWARCKRSGGLSISVAGSESLGVSREKKTTEGTPPGRRDALKKAHWYTPVGKSRSEKKEKSHLLLADLLLALNKKKIFASTFRNLVSKTEVLYIYIHQ